MKLHHCHVSDLVVGDVTRGINHTRILTGPPVRITGLYMAPKRGQRRVRYLILGRFVFGWRDVDNDRPVTVERNR